MKIERLSYLNLEGGDVVKLTEDAMMEFERREMLVKRYSRSLIRLRMMALALSEATPRLEDYVPTTDYKKREVILRHNQAMLCTSAHPRYGVNLQRGEIYVGFNPEDDAVRPTIGLYAKSIIRDLADLLPSGKRKIL